MAKRSVYYNADTGTYATLTYDAYAGYGALPGQMGDHLPAIPLSAPAVRIAAGMFHACATLATGAIQCWGQNEDGQLGWDSTTETSFAAGFVGNALPAVKLAVQDVADVQCGASFTCVLSAAGDVRCFGRGLEGQLGYAGANANRGDGAPAPYDMASLPVVMLGGIAVSLACTGSSAAALLSTGVIKTW